MANTKIKKHERGSVLQDWVQELSWKKQTVLLGALRSPDILTTLKVKQVTVWMRCIILQNADPMTGFMHTALNSLPLLEHMDREFERLPLHAAHHIILSAQVIGQEHPDADVRASAWKFYSDCVRAQHLNPETRDQYESRYIDNPARVEIGTS